MSGPEVDPALAATVARSVLRKNVELRRGEHVIIEGWSHTLPWAVAFAREARRIGAVPMVPYQDEAAYWDSVEAGEDRVLGATPAHEWAALAKSDAYLHFWGPGDRVRLNALPERRVERLQAYNEDWYKVARKAGVRGVRMEIGRPYPSLARAYGVEESEWRRQVIDGTLVDPNSLARAARPIMSALQKGRAVRIYDDRGTDLKLGLSHRKPVVNWGHPDAVTRASTYGVLQTLPAGLVRVALDERVADGTIQANRTSYFDDGRATGARLTFRDGKLTDASFDTGGERFHDPFEKATKGKDQPGILSIGLNPALHDTPQIEDVEEGAVLVAVGGNRHLGGRNPSNFFGWSINAGATLEVDGRKVVGG